MQDVTTVPRKPVSGPRYYLVGVPRRLGHGRRSMLVRTDPEPENVRSTNIAQLVFQKFGWDMISSVSWFPQPVIAFFIANPVARKIGQSQLTPVLPAHPWLAFQ